jgi:hypothetical protein
MSHLRCGAVQAQLQDARHAYFQGAEAARRLPCGVASFVWRTLRVRFQMRRCCAVRCGAVRCWYGAGYGDMARRHISAFLLVPPIPSHAFTALAHG